MIKQLKIGIMDNFSYIIWDNETLDAAIIDPGWEADKLLRIIKENKLRLKYVLLTHLHFDHSKEAKRIKEETGAKIVSAKNEEIIPDIIADKKLSLGKKIISILKTPGHSKEGVCYLYDEKFLFTGDTIFQGGSYGRTDLEGGNFEELKNSIKKILAMNDKIRIRPGHDYGDKKSSTIKEEKTKFKF
jgi:hydroxyacylglutathione hydrolase